MPLVSVPVRGLEVTRRCCSSVASSSGSLINKCGIVSVPVRGLEVTRPESY